MSVYHLECPNTCTFREGTPWSAKASEMLLAGKLYRAIQSEAAAEGETFSLMALTRHRRHIIVAGAEPEPEVAPVKANNIEILEAIIQKGFANQKNWKPTISDTMKAMDMWFRLTQGNPFDDLLDTLAAASMGGDDGDSSNLESGDPANGTADETLVDDS